MDINQQPDNKRMLPASDPRTQPGSPDQYKEHRTTRLSHHRYLQLQAEVDDPTDNLTRQDIINTALGEYFQKRYKAK